MLIPFLFAQQANVDAALDRYANFMKRWSSISVDLRIRSNLYPSDGKGNIVLKRPNCIHFNINWNGSQYVFTQNNSRIVEFERSTKSYRDFMTFQDWATPPGDVSAAPELSFPAILLNNDLRKVPGLSSFKLVKSNPGLRALGLTAKMQVPSGVIDYQFKLDELGRPLHIRSTASPSSGKVIVDLYFSNWITDRQYSPTVFSGAVPSGFVALAMPMDPFPIGVDEKFPTDIWVHSDRRGSSPDSTLFSGKRFLAAIVDSNSAPSSKLIQFLRTNKSALNVRIVLIWNTVPGDALGFDSFVDSSMSATKRCQLSGTPAMFLVSSRGVVQKLWYGFDSARQPALKGEIMEAIKAE